MTERSRFRIAACLAIATVVLLAITVAWFYIWYPSSVVGKSIAQPIAFSHRVHAGDKEIACIFCHAGAVKTDSAQIPPVETCMLCHQRIIIHHPQIARLRNHYYSLSPIEWLSVNNLPDYVFFSHRVHVRAGFDCGKCHGNVASMDRLIAPREFRMGFCVQCHRDENYSHDCLTCHR